MEEQTTASPRYSGVAMALHWLIAGLIAINFAAAWAAEDAGKAAKQQIMDNHEAFGLIILLLSVVRLVWRLVHRAPPFADTLKAWEVALARVTHWLFYLILVALPFTGWAMVSAFTGGKPISLFGLVDVPGLPFAQSKDTAGTFHELHEVFATVTLALFLLHVLAALKHQFVDRDGTMARIVPWGRG